MATEYVGSKVMPGGDHLLIPSATLAAYALIRASGCGVSKVRFGSLK
jgi:hypothetical protein